MPKTLIETGVGAMAVRFLTARRLRALTTAAGVALGVGLVAAITIMGMTLRAALVDQQQAAFGTYDLAVVAEGRLLTAEEVRVVKAGGPIRALAGVLLISPGTPESQGIPLATDYLGVAPMPRGEFAYALKEGRYPGPGEFAARPAVVERLGLKVGDSISLPFKTGDQQVRLAGIRTATGGELGESHSALTFDLSWLQSQMGLADAISSLLVWSDAAALKTNVAGLIKLLAPEVLPVIRSETDAAERGISLVSAWATALGLAAFFAVFFMVAGTFNIAIHERVHELSMLRAIGATPEQVMRLVLREAALLGAVGSLFGLLAGAGFSQLSLGMAAASFGVASRPLVFPVLPLAVEAIGGVLLAIAAAWGPARAAGRVRPLEAMRPAHQAQLQHDSTQCMSGGFLMALGALLIPSGLLLTSGSGFRVLVSTASGLAFVTGLVMVLPRLLPAITGLLAAPLRRLFPVETLIAARSAVRHRRRSALTLTTLLLGVMLLCSVGTFLVEVVAGGERELHRRFPADAMITIDSRSDLGSALAGEIAALPGVSLTVPVAREISGGLVYWDWSVADQAWLQQLAEREAKREVPTDAHKRVRVVGVDLSLYAQIADLGAIQGDPSKGATLSVEAARRRGIKMGDTLSFVSLTQSAEAAQGKSVTPTPLVVTALVEKWPDFTESTIVVTRSLMPAPDQTIYFNYDPASRTETMNSIRQLLDHPEFGMAELRIFADEREENRRQSMQLWSILGAVAIVIFIVSTISLANAIIAGIQARRRELATIRAVGSTPLQTARQVVLEAVLMGLAGSLLGLIAAIAFTTGAFIGLDDAVLRPNAHGLYLGCLLGGPLVGAVAALLPARGISRGPVAEVLRTE